MKLFLALLSFVAITQSALAGQYCPRRGIYLHEVNPVKDAQDYACEINSDSYSDLVFRCSLPVTANGERINVDIFQPEPRRMGDRVQRPFVVTIGSTQDYKFNSYKLFRIYPSVQLAGPSKDSTIALPALGPSVTGSHAGTFISPSKSLEINVYRANTLDNSFACAVSVPGSKELSFGVDKYIGRKFYDRR